MAMASRIEHASITVRDMGAALGFITTALPEFKIRGQDSSITGAWLHVGTEETYIALTRSPSVDPRGRVAYHDLGVNHVGIVVDDVGEVVARLEAAGYKQSSEPEISRWRRRFYFLDVDGFQWEFIQYLSDDPAKKNHYP
jgi:catechol 2,3-dioxygenase-like lactoylglutathione lyase family enzyme